MQGASIQVMRNENNENKSLVRGNSEMSQRGEMLCKQVGEQVL